MTIEAFMITCPERMDMRLATLASLRGSDWGWDNHKLTVIHDHEPPSRPKLEHIYRTYERMVKMAANSSADWVLMLEDDVRFPADFYAHVRRIMDQAEREEDAFVSLYHSPVAKFFGGQAILARRKTIGWAWLHWLEEESLHCDIKLPRLASKVCRTWIIGLVKHVGKSTWGGPEHRAAP